MFVKKCNIRCNFVSYLPKIGKKLIDPCGIEPMFVKNCTIRCNFVAYLPKNENDLKTT